MYDELWTGAKAMYKLEPAIAEGGEVIVYAPHLDVVSHVHGKYIYEAGYHVRDYYLKQWDRFGHLPLGVLAHGTHLRGSGTFENGVEKCRAQVTLVGAGRDEVRERRLLEDRRARVGVALGRDDALEAVLRDDEGQLPDLGPDFDTLWRVFTAARETS